MIVPANTFEMRLNEIQRMLPAFASVLPQHIKPHHFVRVIRTAIQNNSEILECDRDSILNACQRAAEDGLLPDGRHGAIIPFRNKRGGKSAQWIPMILGIRQKVRNAGEITTWECRVVHERDQWDYEEGDSPRIFHKPSAGIRGEVIAAYSVARFKSGEISREWMWRDELDDVRKVSRAGQGGPWEKWEDEMYRKTVAKRHAKILPMSTDMVDKMFEELEPDGLDEPPAPAPVRSVVSIDDRLDALAEKSAAKPHKARRLPPATEIDEEPIEAPQDEGEYAASDDEELPLEESRHGGG